MTIYTQTDSPLGPLLLTSNEGKLSGLYFADQPHARIAPDWVRHDAAGIFAETSQQLAECASWERESFDLPLDLSGTPFQVQVWKAIATIPFGQTITYSELAVRAGRFFQNARAVGNAAGQNPICWIVPCHRVVGKNGALTGYAGGLARKSALLAFESAKSAKRDVILARRESQPTLVLA